MMGLDGLNSIKVINSDIDYFVFLVEIDCPNYSIYITTIIIRCIKRYNDAFSYVFSCE